MAKKAIDKKKQVGKKVEQKPVAKPVVAATPVEEKQVATNPKTPVNSRESEDGHRFAKQASGRDEEGLYDLEVCTLCGKTIRRYRKVPAR